MIIASDEDRDKCILFIAANGDKLLDFLEEMCKEVPETLRSSVRGSLLIRGFVQNLNYIYFHDPLACKKMYDFAVDLMNNVVPTMDKRIKEMEKEKE